MTQYNFFFKQIIMVYKMLNFKLILSTQRICKKIQHLKGIIKKLIKNGVLKVLLLIQIVFGHNFFVEVFL